MIWIATLCLLALAAWLFFNALNERRWVQAHSHDETVASDEGLFAAPIAKVQEKSAHYGEKFFEAKAAAARLGDGEQPPRSAKEENTFFGRAVSRIGDVAGKMDHKLDQKMKAAASQTSHSGSPGAVEEGLFARTTRKVSAKSDEISHSVATRAKNMAQGFSDGRAASGDEGMFGKMVGKVSGSLDKFESKVGSKVSQAATSSAKDEDLVSRVAAKVASASKNTVDKPE